MEWRRLSQLTGLRKYADVALKANRWLDMTVGPHGGGWRGAKSNSFRPVALIGVSGFDTRLSYPGRENGFKSMRHTTAFHVHSFVVS